jgi:serine/threonine-protein kinase
MRHTVPPHVAAVVAKAIEKLPADRFESARDFMEALEDPGFTYTPAVPSATATAQTPASSSPVTAAPWHRDLRVLASLAVAAASLAFAFLRGGGGDDLPLPVTRATVDLGALFVLSVDEVVISPDGSKFAVVGREGDGVAHVYWRNAWEEEFRMIPGTENARFADFSPQGDWIVFRQSRPEALMKVALAGGAPVPIVPAGLQSTRDPHWGDDGTVVFAGPQGRGLYRVSANGGEPEALDEELAVREPYLLPGGRFIAAVTLDTELILFDLDGDSVIPLDRTGMNPSYVDAGHLLYVDLGGQLWAAPLDLRTGALSQGVPIQGGIHTSRGVFARYSVSRTGTAVFGFGGDGTAVGEEAELVVVDETGGVAPLRLSPRNIDEVRWSPAGDEVTYTSAETPGDPPQIFTYDVALGTTPRQLTYEGFNVSPVWSPDGTAIAFASRRDGTQGMDVFVKALGNDDPPRIVATLEDDQLPRHWPRENALVVSDGDLWIMDLTGDSTTLTPYLDTEAALWSAQVDPLGEYAVYVTQDGPASAREIFGRRFPEAGQPTRIFERPGSTPVWAPSGDAVFLLYLSNRGAEIVRADIGRDPLRVLSRSVIEVEGGDFDRWLDIHPDGSRFLMIRTGTSRDPGEEASAPERHVVVVNWLDELRARLGESN